MARPKALISDIVAREAEAQLRKIKNSKQVIQIKAILAARENPINQVAQIFRVSPSTIFRWAHRFKEDGLDGLKDRPKGHNPSKLSEEQKKKVVEWVVEARRPSGEPILWTVKKLQVTIQEEFGISLAKTPLWLFLRKRNLVPRRPGPSHAKGDPEARKQFKKNG